MGELQNMTTACFTNQVTIVYNVSFKDSSLLSNPKVVSEKRNHNQQHSPHLRKMVDKGSVLA